MTDEMLQRELIRLFAGVLISSTQFLRLLDSPGMTIDRLRESPETVELAKQEGRLRAWMIAAIDNTPRGILTPQLREEFLKTYREGAESAKVGGE